MKRFRPFPVAALRLSPLLAAALAGVVLAAPTKLGTLPLSLEPGKNLQALNASGIQKLFPSGNRPDAVLLSSDNKVSLAFEWRDAKLSSADLNTVLTQFPAVIRAQVPGVKSLKQSLVTMNGTPWADFVFVAPGKTGTAADVRRELLVTSAQGRMLVLTISGTLSDYAKNEADVKALTGSIRVN